MLELTMTTFRAHEAPATLLDQPNDLAHLHETTVSHRDTTRAHGCTDLGRGDRVGIRRGFSSLSSEASSSFLSA